MSYESYEGLPTEPACLPVLNLSSRSHLRTSGVTRVACFVTGSIAFVTLVSVLVSFLNWRLFGYMPSGANAAAREGTEDDDKMDSRLPSVIRPFAGVDQESNICRTVACEAEGSKLFQQLEFHQEPCDDFYAFVCKRWMLNHKLPLGAAKVSVDDSLVDEYELFLADVIQKGRPGYEAVRAIFLRCEYPWKGNTHLVETLSKIGLHPFPLMLSEELSLDGIVKALTRLGIQPYYSLSVERDFENPEQSFLLVGEPVLLMGPQRLGVNMGYAYLDEALSQFMMEIDENQTISDNVLKVENLLSSFMDRHPEESPGLQKELADVTAQFPQLGRRIRTAVAQVFGTDFAKQPIKTASLRYLHAVENGLITKEHERFLNYLAFRAFLELSPDNDRDLGELMALVYSRYPGYTSYRPASRRRFCVRMINRYEPALVMHMTMDAAINKLGGSASFSSLLNLLENVFNETISNQTGFDSDFRDSVLEIVSAVNWEPIVPIAVTSHSEIFRRLVSIYETAVGSKYVMESFMSLATMFKFRDSAQKDLNKWVGWRRGMLSTYAHLQFPFSKLEIPLAVFDFRGDGDASMERLQIPRIGPRVFYAMYQAVYHLASNYEAGKKPVLLVSKLRALMECLGRQYGKLHWKDSRRRLGRNSFYSNLMDFLVLRPSFEAYLRYADFSKKNQRLSKLENLTPRQLFFVEYARNFCEVNNATFLNRVLHEGRVSPAWYRVNGPLRNFEPFADAFMCRPNTFMNPVHRCSLQS